MGNGLYYKKGCSAVIISVVPKFDYFVRYENQFIKQQIEKGFAMYVYDFKFPDLSEIAYNHLLNNQGGYKKVPTFYVINFDDPARSHRCNPINPSFMSDISDAYESAYTIMLNLNKTGYRKRAIFLSKVRLYF